MVVDTRIYKGVLSDGNATLYTVPASTKVIIKSVTMCNTTGTAATVTLKLAGVELFAEYEVKPNDTITIQPLDQIINAAEIIEAVSGTAAAIAVYISGKEIS